MAGHGQRRLIDQYFISKIENDQGGVLFEAKPKIACAECDIPVIYGNTPKSDVLENKGHGRCRRVWSSRTAWCRSHSWNRQTVRWWRRAVRRYALHVINTRPSFLIKSALNTNIFGENWQEKTSWRAGRDLQRHDIGGKTGTATARKMHGSPASPGVVTSVWIGFDDHRRDLGRTTASGAIKDQISGYEGGAKVRNRPGMPI